MTSHDVNLTTQIATFHRMFQHETCDEMLRFVTKDQKQKMNLQSLTYFVTFHHMIHVLTCDQM